MSKQKESIFMKGAKHKNYADYNPNYEFMRKDLSKGTPTFDFMTTRPSFFRTSDPASDQFVLFD